MDKDKQKKKSKLNFTKNKKWLRRKADAEEKAGCVSAGGFFAGKSKDKSE